MKDARIIYPIYMELSQRFHLGLVPCGELESSPLQAAPGTRLPVERWFQDADTRIEVHHLRELLGQVSLAADALQALLAWHLGKDPKDKPDRDKIDFFLVQYLAERLPVNVPAHKLSFEQAAEVLRPVLGERSVPKRLPGLEDCIRDLEKCFTLGDFIEYWILERGRALKAVAQEGPFDHAKLVAFTHFSFLLRLSSIRVLHDDIRGLEEDLKELENKGVQEVDIAPDRSDKKSVGELRALCEKWKRYFPDKYSRNQWFTEIIGMRSSVQRALQGPVSEPEGAAASAGEAIRQWTEVAAQGAAPLARPAPPQQTHPRTQPGAQLQAEVERYMYEIAEQVQSPIGGRATSVTAIELAGLRLMLSTGEVDAFQEACEGMNFVLQHAAAVRAILLAALDKDSPDAATLRAAVDLAELEGSALQEQINVARETGDTAAAVNLAASARSLRKALEKMDQTLLARSGELPCTASAAAETTAREGKRS